MIEVLKPRDTAVRWTLFIILFLAFAYINLPFVIPMALAGVFALGLQDFIMNMSRRTKLRPGICIAATISGGIALFLIPISFSVYRVVSRVTQPDSFRNEQITAQFLALKEFAISRLQTLSHWTGTDLATPARELLENVIGKAGQIFLTFSTQFFTELPIIFLGLLVFTITLTVMLLRAPGVKDFVLEYSPLDRATTEPMIKIFKKSCSVTLFSTLLIGLIQASIIGFGSLAMGEGDFWLVLTVTFFVSFIPVIGAAPVGYLLAILAFFGGRTGSGIGMVLIATFAGGIDNILKPLLVSGEFKINGVVAFSCVVGAIIVLGLPGLLFGPVIMNLFVGLAPLLLKNKGRDELQPANE